MKRQKKKRNEAIVILDNVLTEDEKNILKNLVHYVQENLWL